MKTLIPYLTFGGQCEAALQFYAEALRGRVKNLMRAGDVQQACPAQHKHMIMHAEFEADGAVFMASDGNPDAPLPPGGKVALSLTLDSVAEQDRVWAALSQGGTIVVPLHQAFWGSRFGVITDKFGIAWMLSCDPGTP